MNVVLVDFKTTKDWDFLNILNKRKEEWTFESCRTNKLMDSKGKVLLRYFCYMLFPLFIVIKRRKYKKIVAWQQFYGLNYAFWCRLFHLPKINDLTVMTFIYCMKKGRIGRIYHRYMSYVVKSKYIDRFIVFSQKEATYYSSCFNVPIERFIYTPLGVKPEKKQGAGNPTNKNLVFSCGRSGRDYDFLIDALNGSEYHVVIACDIYKRKNLPDNVTVLDHCFGEDMNRILNECFCVVIPLRTKDISNGQLMILKAMSIGKPIIATKSNGVVDYIQDGVNGFLIENNPKELLEKLEALQDQDEYHRISENCIEIFSDNFSSIAMYNRISEILNV